MPRKPQHDDSESEGSLKDFIVDDAAEEEHEDDETVSDESGTDAEDSSEDSSDTSDESSDDASDDHEEEAPRESKAPVGPAAAGGGTSGDRSAEERPSKRRRHDETDELELMKAEAEKFAAGVAGTVVGGRTLRSRAPEHVESRKPRDAYYEKYGRAEEAKLMEKFTKKDIVEFVARLAPDHRASYEAAGHVWPSLNVRMSLDDIRAEYEKIKAFLDLPDSDKETSDDEDEEEGSDDDTEEDSDDDDEDD